MRYFTRQLMFDDNAALDLKEEERQIIDDRFWATVEEYHLQLDNLRPRLSKAAWQFFRHGYGPTGMHDARLLALKIGDGLNFAPDGRLPFRRNYQRAQASIEFLNYEQIYHYRFELRGIKSISTDLFPDDPADRFFGDLSTYEISAIDADLLYLGFLFSSGATIVFQFRKLIFKRHRLRPEYNLGDIY